MSEWEKFFEYQNRLNFSWESISQYNEVQITAEELYQHFKARLIDEIVVSEERSALLSDDLDFPPEQLMRRKVFLLHDTRAPE